MSELSVAARLALQASNVALRSVVNLVFPVLYVHHRNKELTPMFLERWMGWTGAVCGGGGCKWGSTHPSYNWESRGLHNYLLSPGKVDIQNFIKCETKLCLKLVS